METESQWSGGPAPELTPRPGRGDPRREAQLSSSPVGSHLILSSLVISVFTLS